jgi:DNA-binding transcriptional MerR regulator
MKRGGGRRYYRPEDVDLLKGIRHLLYDHGYTIKGVQKLLKTNGNKFVVAVGHGDLASVEALSGNLNDTVAGEPRVAMAEEDQIVGRAKPPITRRFFNFVSGEDDQPEISVGKSSVGKEDRALLQEALYDLLECKRLLDQVR